MPDLLLTDVQMPQMDELLKVIENLSRLILSNTQTGNSHRTGMFDQENNRVRSVAQSAVSCGNSALVSQKSLRLCTSFSNSSNCTGLQR
jgi:CheY-like chemotaxis protein